MTKNSSVLNQYDLNDRPQKVLITKRIPLLITMTSLKSSAST